MDKLTLTSYAKLNLYLQVLGRRKDKYHNLRTLFERISLRDTIILKSRPDKRIRIISASRDIPRDGSNLCARAAALLRKELRVSNGVDITIIKRIPVGSGMGGGSSNAASTLVGLNKLWGTRLSRNKLIRYAREVGADVPFFLRDCRFAFAGQRGDRIKPLKELRGLKLWQVVAVPGIKVSTPLAYKKWDELKEGKKVKLTLPKHNAKILTLALKKKDLPLVKAALFNSLEEATLRLYPQLKKVRRFLLRQGLEAILMSGSGPALFGIVPSSRAATLLVRRLKRKNKSLRIFSACSV